MKNLNPNDKELLVFCEEWKFIGEIARHLEIAPKNVSVRVNKLKKLLHVNREGKGKKTKVRTKKSVTYPEYAAAILKHINEKGGIFEEELDLLMNDKKFNSPFPHVKEYDKNIAKWIIKSGERPMTKSKLFVNRQGEVYLKLFDEKNRKKKRKKSKLKS